MSPPLSDTSPDAARVQLELLRGATLARRYEAARALTATTIGLALEAIRAAMPGASEDEIRVRFVEIHHGRELAERLAEFLARRRS